MVPLTLISLYLSGPRDEQIKHPDDARYHRMQARYMEI